MTAARITCPGCLEALRLSRATGGTWWPCPVHGVELAGEPRPPAPPASVIGPSALPSAPSRPRALHWVPGPEVPTGRLVPAFVGELLRWDAGVASVERLAFGGASSNFLMLVRVAELGIVGSGNRGTKGVGGKPLEDDAEGLEVVKLLDPVWAERYRALRGEDRRTADAVIADGQGEDLVEVQCGGRAVECDLAQRVALILAPAHQVERWRAKIAAGDSRPALRGAEDLGTELLEHAARAWFGAT
jgi:hypothetical protein